MRRLPLLVFSVVFLTACASSKPEPEKIIPRADLQALTNEFNTEISKDPQLKAIFGQFRPSGTKHPESEPFGNLAVNRKAWDELGSAQRELVVKKAAATFSGLFLNSPVRRAEVATVYLVEGGSDLGWFHVRTSSGDFLYRVAGQ